MASSLALSVRRSSPILVAPTEPTPRELKALSASDQAPGLRVQVPVLLFYRCDPTSPNATCHPAATIRTAISKALVYYYPLAGRLRESGDGQKLTVDCTGEGVLFIEAESDIRLEQLGDRILPPFPYLEDLLHDVEGSSGILHSPLLLVQVTQLSCGGFVLAIRFNHVVCDGKGLNQFLTAVGELARGAARPSVTPVWQRDLLDFRTTTVPPSSTTGLLRLYDKEAPEERAAHFVMLEDQGRAINRSFFFGHKELSTLRKQLSPQSQPSYSTFEILTACLWRCRTVALRPEPSKLVRILFPVDVRTRMTPPIPAGYYGNCLVLTSADSRAGDLCSSTLQYAVELVHKAKSEITPEFIQAQLNILATDSAPEIATVWSYMVSNLMHAGFDRIDLGWGAPLYGGLPSGHILGCWLTPIRNTGGEIEGFLIVTRSPAPAMERFIIEIKGMTSNAPRSGGQPAAALLSESTSRHKDARS